MLMICPRPASEEKPADDSGPIIARETNEPLIGRRLPD
jgi:hypothetical protein